MQSVKITFSKFQQKQFDRYAQARRVDLPSLITDRYQIQFSGVGNNLDAEGHGLRLGMKDSNDEKIWLANGTAAGDAVQVVQQLDKSYLNKVTSKNEAIKTIEDFAVTRGTSKSTISSNARSEAAPQEFKLTNSHRDTSGVIADYIKARGIGWKTFNNAIEAGFADKTNDGVRFIGLDANGQPRNAETRLIVPRVLGGKLTKFICAPGSDRSYPPVLPGTDKGEVHIVEGGFSAFGLKEIMNRQGKSPTIIVSGGKDNTSWLKHAHIQALVMGAEVTLHTENEKTSEIQAVADEAANKQCEALRKVGAGKIVMQRPPINFKDNADLNLYQKTQELEKQAQLKTK